MNNPDRRVYLVEHWRKPRFILVSWTGGHKICRFNTWEEVERFARTHGYIYVPTRPVKLNQQPKW